MLVGEASSPYAEFMVPQVELELIGSPHVIRYRGMSLGKVRDDQHRNVEDWPRDVRLSMRRNLDERKEE